MIYNSRNYIEAIALKYAIGQTYGSTIVEIILRLLPRESGGTQPYQIYNSRNYIEAIATLPLSRTVGASTIVEIILRLLPDLDITDSYISTIVEIILRLLPAVIMSVCCFIYNSRNYIEAIAS